MPRGGNDTTVRKYSAICTPGESLVARCAKAGQPSVRDIPVTTMALRLNGIPVYLLLNQGETLEATQLEGFIRVCRPSEEYTADEQKKNDALVKAWQDAKQTPSE